MFKTMSERDRRRCGGRRRRWARWAVAWALLGCLAGSSPTTMALPISFDYLMDIDYRPEKQQDLSAPEQELATRWIDPYYWGDDDMVSILLDRVIRDENWSEWQVYHADTEARIPLAASQQVIRSMSRLGPVEKRLLVRMARMPEVRNAVVAADKEDELVERVFALFAPQKQIGPISEAPLEREVGSFLALDFLFAEEGIFSGRPWDWDNFLPRILTLSGLVIGGLLLVEFLRLVVQLGVRTLSLRSRSRK